MNDVMCESTKHLQTVVEVSRMQQLVDATLDGVATAEELHELVKLLRANDDCRQEYIELVQQHASLIDMHRPRSSH
jgi:hypothetical protein